MPIEIVRTTIPLSHLTDLARDCFGDLVKAVVDVELEVMAIGGELHADEEATLLDAGSGQTALWGINLYPAQFGGEGWIEFDSMINVRPGRAIDRASSRTMAIEPASWTSSIAW